MTSYSPINVKHFSQSDLLQKHKLQTFSIDVDTLLKRHYFPFLTWPSWFQRLVSWLLRLIIRQNTVNKFLSENSHLQSFDFIEKAFDELCFNYHFNAQDLENIPAKGGVIIFANHPLGALDGLSLLHLVSLVRRDVKIVANQLLSNITPLAPLLLPVDNLKGDSRKQDLVNIARALEADQAVIFFPAGEVSRLSPKGIQDKVWDAGFLRFSERLNLPMMPIYIKARNSGLFYSIARFSSTASMLLLPLEMIRYSGRFQFFTSPVITPEQLAPLSLSRKEKVNLLRKHLYQLPKNKPPVFTTKKSLIHPQSRQSLRLELKSAEKLGSTSDGKSILLFTPLRDSVVLDELGRLREEAFRAVGEGTGHKKDTDLYDAYYRHIIVWDDDLLEIAGAYRLGEVWKWCKQDESCFVASQHHFHRPSQGLYSESLFKFRDGSENGIANNISEVMEAGLELGRSFVQPQFWGKRSLDYLWQGIGAYIARHPKVRYLFGPVSLSASLPARARDMLVWYYQNYYPESHFTAEPRAGFKLSTSAIAEMEKLMDGNDPQKDYANLRDQLSHMQMRVPTLYKQYSELCHYGGVSFSAFNVDSDFSMCLDSFVMVDLKKLKPAKYARYVEPYLSFDTAPKTQLN